VEVKVKMQDGRDLCGRKHIKMQEVQKIQPGTTIDYKSMVFTN